jgi:hypothetical protein
MPEKLAIRCGWRKQLVVIAIPMGPQIITFHIFCYYAGRHTQMVPPQKSNREWRVPKIREELSYLQGTGSHVPKMLGHHLDDESGFVPL